MGTPPSLHCTPGAVERERGRAVQKVSPARKRAIGVGGWSKKLGANARKKLPRMAEEAPANGRKKPLDRLLL